MSSGVQTIVLLLGVQKKQPYSLKCRVLKVKKHAFQPKKNTFLMALCNSLKIRGALFTEKNGLFLKKSNARFFQKQAVFFRICTHGISRGVKMVG